MPPTRRKRERIRIKIRFLEKRSIEGGDIGSLGSRYFSDICASHDIGEVFALRAILGMGRYWGEIFVLRTILEKRY
jgi:hypothetical protein